MGLLDGKVALITGAARGQGRSHAVRFASEGADIIAVDVCAQYPGIQYGLATPDDVAETVDLIEAHDRRAVVHQVDVRDGERLTKAVEESVAELGRLDIVLANAGVIIYGTGEPSWEMSSERWQVLMDVNVTGTFNTLKATVPAIIAGGRGGAIVVTSSTAGLEGVPQLADYTTSKHAVVGLTRSFAQELAPYDIRINTVHPTGVLTPMIENDACAAMVEANPSIAQNFANLLDVETVQPSDITDAMLFLVSDHARFITGHALPVDAGHMAR